MATNFQDALVTFNAISMIDSGAGQAISSATRVAFTFGTWSAITTLYGSDAPGATGSVRNDLNYLIWKLSNKGLI